MITLNNDEKKRLKKAIAAIYAIPFVDDIEDFIWEAVFAYTKNVPLVDPLINTRKKLLFDVTDSVNQIGWSIKASQHAISLPFSFEVVIQRADIFKKANALGFDNLTIDSPTQELGAALLKHWYEGKVDKDAKTQNVTDKRICVLLKSIDRTEYVYYEDKLRVYKNKDLIWTWTDETKTGLQARRKKDKVLVFRWYPNQKQFFERFALPKNAYSFSIDPVRLVANDVVQILLEALEGKL